MKEPRWDLSQVNRTEFVNAIVHLYRGELGEAAAWRSRIDATSHWAVVVSATALTFVFSDRGSRGHIVIPIVTLFCTFLLQMEARRYRFFDIWRSRARILEINFYRPLLANTTPATADWAEVLADDLTWPRVHMPWWEAFGRRLRRNYQWIFATLLVCWMIALVSQPTATLSVDEVTRRAAVGPVSGGIVIVAMLLFYMALASLGTYSFWMSRVARKLPAGHPERMRQREHDSEA
jgi:uncharacterized membrane protein